MIGAYRRETMKVGKKTRIFIVSGLAAAMMMVSGIAAFAGVGYSMKTTVSGKRIQTTGIQDYSVHSVEVIPKEGNWVRRSGDPGEKIIGLSYDTSGLSSVGANGESIGRVGSGFGTSNIERVDKIKNGIVTEHTY